MAARKTIWIITTKTLKGTFHT
uniref:NERD domain-containing protein n=1 Tax=Arundo donax TaxID=35708 RepID=A0A0A9H897_ARUDO